MRQTLLERVLYYCRMTISPTAYTLRDRGTDLRVET